MKQFRCWAYVVNGKVACLLTSEHRPAPLASEPHGQWIEMTGEVPEAEAENQDTEAKPVDEPPSEPKKTCEIRWLSEYGEWHVGVPGLSALECPTFAKLVDAQARARRLGLRVTNDPREVVLKQYDEGWHLLELHDGFWTFDGAQYPLRLSNWLERVKARGWRILREEPAVVPPPYDNNTCQVIWSDEIHRWEIVIKQNPVDQRGFASLTEALEHADRLKLHVTNRADALQGAKILEAEKLEQTCEVRWDEASTEWEIRADEFHWARRRELGKALQYAAERGWRVTNDPREVVLREDSPGRWCLQEGKWQSFTSGNKDSLRAMAIDSGWHILREEPAEQKFTCTFCGKTDKEVGLLFVEKDSGICDGCLAACNRVMTARLVEVIGRDKR
jgi:hypothetical protein